MKEWFKKLFETATDVSMTRFGFFWMVVNAVLMGWYILIWGTDHATEASMVMGSVTSIATGLKLYQKHQEK